MSTTGSWELFLAAIVRIDVWPKHTCIHIYITAAWVHSCQSIVDISQKSRRLGCNGWLRSVIVGWGICYAQSIWMTKWALKWEAGGRMRFQRKADFLLTNWKRSRSAPIPWAQSGCVNKIMTPSLSTINHTSCEEEFGGFQNGEFSFLNIDSLFSDLDLNQHWEQKKREEWINAQPVFAKSPVASNQHFFVTCRSQQCSQTIRAFGVFLCLHVLLINLFSQLKQNKTVQYMFQ